MEYGFAFLIYMYESYLLFFNDWQSRLIIARCLTFVPPFRARAVFLGLIPPCLPMPVVVQSLCYGCQFWTVSHKVEEHWLSSSSIYHQCFKQTFYSTCLCSLFYYKLGRQIIQQIVEGAASNNRVYLQESETTGKCHTLFY